ncbi:hypothetical protein AXF11_10200 [Leptotrichia sp. oral taxon 847]|nr:hypothetical protein AXF11_10200 [Leptotrichia sp. oral taxon 847]
MNFYRKKRKLIRFKNTFPRVGKYIQKGRNMRKKIIICSLISIIVSSTVWYGIISYQAKKYRNELNMEKEKIKKCNEKISMYEFYIKEQEKSIENFYNSILNKDGMNYRE